MLTATWMLAGATVVIALAAPVAFITWRQALAREREQRAAERERQAKERALEDGRKEFASKNLLWGILAVAGLVGLAAYGSLKNEAE